MTIKESVTFWPLLKQSNGFIPQETLELALKCVQHRIKFLGFNYKQVKKTKYLSLLQVVFTHGYNGPIMKAKKETENNIQSALLKDD